MHNVIPTAIVIAGAWFAVSLPVGAILGTIMKLARRGGR